MLNRIFLFLILISFSANALVSQIKVPEVTFPIEITNIKKEVRPKLLPPKTIKFEQKISIILVSQEIPPYPPYDVPPPVGTIKKPKTVFGGVFQRKKALLSDAVDYFFKEKYIFAEAKLKKLIEEFPKSKEAAIGRYLLGLIYYNIGDENKSKIYFSMACEYKGAFDLKSESCLGAVIMSLRTKDLTNARKYFGEVYTPEHSNDYYFWKGVLDILAGNKDRAYTILKDINCHDLEVNTVSYCEYTKAYIELYKKHYDKSLQYALNYKEDSPYKKHLILIAGFDYLGLGDYFEAERFFNTYIEKYGKVDKLSNYAIYGIGIINLYKNRLKEAEKIAAVLETRDENLSQNIYLKLAEKYANADKYEEGLAYLQKAVNISAKYKEFLKKKISVTAYNAGRYEYALNIMKTIDDPLFYLYSAFASLNLGNYDLAEKYLKKAFYKAQIKEIKEIALKYLAEIYFETKKDQLLLNVIKALKTYDPTYASNLLGWYYFEKGHYRKAYEAFVDNYMKAVSAFNAGDVDTAYQLVKDKTDRKSLFLKSYIYLEKGKIKERRRLLKWLAKGDDEIAVQAGYLYAYSYFATGDYERAIEEFKKFIKKHRNHPLARNAILRIGDSYYNLGKIKIARRIYKEFIQKYSNTPEAIDAAYQLTVLEMKSSSASMEKQIESFIRKYPNYPFVNLLKLQLAELYTEKGKYEKAEDIYQELLNSGSKEAEYALYRLAYLYYKIGNIQKTKEYINRYLSTYPKGSFAITIKELLAKIYEDEKDYEKALALYQELPSTDNNKFKIGSLLYKLERYEEAKGYFEELYKKYPQMRNDIAYYLGKINYYTGNLNDAIKYLEEAVQTKNYNYAAESYYLLGEIYKKLGEDNKALNSYLNVIYLYPEAKELVIKARLEASDLLKKQGKKMEASCIIKPLLKTADDEIFNIVVSKLKELPRCNK